MMIHSLFSVPGLVTVSTKLDLDFEHTAYYNIPLLSSFGE